MSLLTAIRLGIGAVVGSAGIASISDSVYTNVKRYIDEGGWEGIARGKINDQLQKAGVNLVLTNVSDKEALKNDIDLFIAQEINRRLGTELTRVKGLSKDEILGEVGKVIAQRINAETGSSIVSVFPVSRLRDELGTELMRQFDGSVDLQAGSLFPRNRVLQIQGAILKKVSVGSALEKVAANPLLELERAKARARQKKFRRSHKQIWVQR